MSSLPVVVIGAGPVGLAAAAHLEGRRLPFLVLEAGDTVGSSVRAWGHVRLFSPWRYDVDAAARGLLERRGWSSPDPEAHPTGAELVERYLVPLARTPELEGRIRLRARVASIARSGLDKLKSKDRTSHPFVVHVERDGVEERIAARAVIDASGTWTSPNPLGGDGAHALGERAASDLVRYGIPDVLGEDRSAFVGRRVAVVGSGHSAFNVLADLARLAELEPATKVTWIVRRPSLAKVFGGGSRDQLPERGRLGSAVRGLVDRGGLEVVTGFRVERVERSDLGARLVSGDRAIGPFDRIVASTGFRPDLSFVRELRLGLDPAVEAPVALAPMIDPELHSCGSVPPHGVRELAHPDEGYYAVGMKSYGRAPTFLMLTGYEQVRSVVAAIAGDLEAAHDVRLVLPETGVCVLDDAAKSSCCAPVERPARAAGCC